MQGFPQDFRYAFRQIGKSPGFTAVCVITLALGIGANTAVFTVMNTVMLRYLPVPNPQQLVYLHTTGWPNNASQTGFFDDLSLNQPTYEELRHRKDVFSDLVAFVPVSVGKTAVRFGRQSEEARADMVSGNYFSGLGVRLARGRLFTPDDESQHTRVATLSFQYWTSRFSRDPGVIGQSIFIKGAPFTVVGIAAEGFRGIATGTSTDIWIPLQAGPAFTPWGNAREGGKSLYDSPNWWCLMTMGRLAPGISQKEALARLAPTFERTAYAGAGQPRPNDKKFRIFFSTARGIEGLRDEYERPLLMLGVMVILVLLISCTNVAMLFVARNASREREFGVRMALGAGRKRLFLQLMAESLIVVFAGAVAAWLCAMWGTHALAAWSALDITVTPDRNVLAFTVAISLAAGLVFGLAPLFRAGQVSVASVLKTSAATANTSRERSNKTRAVLALQAAMCLMLLVGAGLLLRTIQNLENKNLGMRASGLFVFGIDPPKERFQNDDAIIRLFTGITRRLRVVPGVESVSIMQNRIGGGWSNNTIAYVDGVKPKERSGMRWNAVGSDYFHVLGVPILAGREVTDADTPRSPQVAVVNQTFANQFLPNTDPIGHHIGFDGTTQSQQYRIVGMVRDSNYTSVREKPMPMAYFPYTQVPGIPGMHFELHIQGPMAPVLENVRRVVRGVDPDLAMLKPVMQSAQFQESFSNETMFARLSIFFGGLAALLVAVGLYGSLAYRVSRRTVEIGVRMAVGAQKGEVLWMVLREGLILAAAGVIIGVPAALLASRLLRSMLFGLEPSDPLTFAGAIVGVVLVTVFASAIPARRAASVQPIQALRME